MDNRDARLGDNGGPPLEDEHVPEWGRRGIGNYFGWKRAHRAAWRRMPAEIARRRAEKAEALGLSYEEYALELLERGRYLHAGDTGALAKIMAKRGKPHAVIEEPEAGPD